MREVLAITNALADEGRLRAVLALGSGELCVCQLVELLGLAPSTVSKHLTILKQARVVEARKQGRWIYYSLPSDDAPAPVREALAWVLRSLTGQHSADKSRLKEILKIDPEILCKRQMQGLRCCSSVPATPAAARWRKAGRAISKPRRLTPTRPESSRTR